MTGPESGLGSGGIASYLKIFAESLNVHLLLVGSDKIVLAGPEGLRGMCAWMCNNERYPCTDICLRPRSGYITDDIVRLKQCPLGLTVFSSPVFYRGELLGHLRGGGVLPGKDFLPDVDVLMDTGMDRSDACAAAAMATGNSHRPLTELTSLLRGVKKSLQVFSGTLKLKSAAERRIQQVEGLFASLEGLHSDLPLKEITGIFLNSLTIFFGIEAICIAVPRPLDQGLYFLVSSGDQTVLPGGKSTNASDRFTRFYDTITEPFFIKDTVALMEAGFPEKTSSAWLFPVTSGGRKEGILVIVNALLTEEDIRIIRGYVGSLGQAMRIYRLEREEETLHEEREFLLSLVRELMGTVDQDDIYDILLTKACSITGAEKGSLMLRDEDGRLAVKKTLGPDEEILRGYRIQPGEGIAGRVLQTGSPVWVRDVSKDLDGRKPVRPRYKTGSFISFPLIPGNSPPGVLNLSDKRSGSPFTKTDLDRVRTISDHTLLAIERAYYLEKFKIVSSQASTDHLTGLANRKRLMEVLSTELARCQRHGRPLSVVMADVDRFKEYNDLNGHLAGDEALKVIAAVLKQSVRNIDLACRYGGEEFCLVLPEIKGDEAITVAERIRHEIEKTRFPGEEGMASGSLTLSLGVSDFPGPATTVHEIIHSADVALYSAKRDGRNRVSRGIGDIGNQFSHLHGKETPA
jgi:diguanylate cyclase (GGDEF)-like protein